MRPRSAPSEASAPVPVRDRERECATEPKGQRQQPRRGQQHLARQHRGEGRLRRGHRPGDGQQAGVHRGRGRHRRQQRHRDAQAESGGWLRDPVGEPSAGHGAQREPGDEHRHHQAEGVGRRAEDLRQQPRPDHLERQRDEPRHPERERGDPRAPEPASAHRGRGSAAATLAWRAGRLLGRGGDGFGHGPAAPASRRLRRRPGSGRRRPRSWLAGRPPAAGRSRRAAPPGPRRSCWPHRGRRPPVSPPPRRGRTTGRRPGRWPPSPRPARR